MVAVDPIFGVETMREHAVFSNDKFSSNKINQAIIHGSINLLSSWLPSRKKKHYYFPEKMMHSGNYPIANNIEIRDQWFLEFFSPQFIYERCWPSGPPNVSCASQRQSCSLFITSIWPTSQSQSSSSTELCLQTSDERRGTSEDDWGRQIGINFWSWKSLVQSCSWKGLFSLEKSKPSWAHFFQNITLNITRIDQATMANAHDDIVETLPRPKRPLSAYNMFFGMCFVLFECVTIKHRV